MPVIKRRAFIAGIIGIGATILGGTYLLVERYWCGIGGFLLDIRYDLFLSNNSREAVIVDIRVTYPRSNQVTLSDTVKIQPDGHDCYIDPFPYAGYHKIEISVHGGPSASEIAECCLFVHIDAERIEFSTAF